jgi:hypothetical protein
MSALDPHQDVCGFTRLPTFPYPWLIRLRIWIEIILGKDRDPHVSKNYRASDAQTGVVDVHSGGVEAQNGALEAVLRILIRIKVISWIRIQIRIEVISWIRIKVKDRYGFRPASK